MTGRSNALLGTQAQYEHSPPTSSRSTIATCRPAARARSATFCPIGPAPSTTTSNSVTAAIVTDPAGLWLSAVGRSHAQRGAVRRDRAGRQPPGLAVGGRQPGAVD